MKIPSETGTEDDVYVFRLFVAGEEPHSRMARVNLQNICNAHIRHCKIEIVDVLKSYQTALDNRIFLTPALMMVSPGPSVTIFGNLNDTEEVMKVLRLGDMHDG